MGKVRFSVCVFIPILLLALAQSTLSGEATEGKSTKVATKLEAFFARKGELIVKNFYSLGDTIPGSYGSEINIQALVISRPGQASGSKKGLVIEVKEGGKYEKKERAFLDMEEIESLSQALKYMVALAKKWEGTQKEYTEVMFTTKGDFKVGFYQAGNKQVAFASCGYVGKTTCWLSIPRLDVIGGMADKGLKLLEEKGE